MKLDSRVLLQEIPDRLGFVSREVVEDDVNLLLARTPRYDFFEKGDEFAAGVTSGRFAMDATGCCLQRRIQRKVPCR